MKFRVTISFEVDSDHYDTGEITDTAQCKELVQEMLDGESDAPWRCDEPYTIEVVQQ